VAARVRVVAALLLVAVPLLVPPAAPSKTVAFSGSCSFAGPIEPMPPITAVPKPGAHFSYSGIGSCTGSLPGPIHVTFTNVATVFDTCEFGPDFGLRGTATIGSGAQRALFKITINLSRLALAGPFSLTTGGGGQAAGVAQFQPPNQSAAPKQCASSGIGSATLSASFHTVSPLVGSPDPTAPVAPHHKARRPRPDRQRPAPCSHRGKCSHHG
jgi:hypothetical protein